MARSPQPGPLLEGTVIDPGAREAVVETAEGHVRVRGVVLGDRIRLRVTHRGLNAMWGECVEVLEPSPERVEHRCALIATCGGCPWQAWDPAAQRVEKRQRLERFLGPHTSAPVHEPLHAETDYGYRNKLLVAAGGRAGALHFGLYAPRSRTLVPADACPVQSDVGAAVLDAVRGVLNEQRWEPVHDDAPGGWLKHALVRVAPGTDQVGVTLVLRLWPCPQSAAVGRALLEIPGVASVWANHSPHAHAVALGPKSAPLAGRHRLNAAVGAVRYLLTPFVFFQTNSPALPLLVSAVGAALPERMNHLVDLYAGVGLFTLAFAERARQVTAVEAHPVAAKDLSAAVRMHGHEHVTVRAADAGEVRVKGPRPDAVIVDPPRGGLPEGLIERLAGRLAPQRLVYVSCSPRALAVDLERLASRGYRARAIQPIDLFPHTPHVEAVVTLDRDPERPRPLSRQARRRRARRGDQP